MLTVVKQAHQQVEEQTGSTVIHVGLESGVLTKSECHSDINSFTKAVQIFPVCQPKSISWTLLRAEDISDSSSS